MDMFDTAKEIDAELTRLMNDPESTPFLPETLPFNLACWNLNCDEELSNDKPNTTQGHFQPEQNFESKNTYRNENYFHDPLEFTGTFACPPYPFPIAESSPRLMTNNIVQQEPRLETPPIPNNGYFPCDDPFAKLQRPRGPIVMVYGLDPKKSNPDTIFNLFCLYGNVIIVKFLVAKQGCAMVQMDSIPSVKRCIDNLNNIPLLRGTIQLVPSKHQRLAMSSEPSILPDSSLSYKEYFYDRNHRFKDTVIRDINMNRPSKVVYFYNTPPSITVQTFFDVCEKKDARKPFKHLFLRCTPKSSSGLLEFETVEYAVDFLFTCNHYEIVVPKQNIPYTLKLNFSRSQSISPKETIKEVTTNEDGIVYYRPNKTTTKNYVIKEDTTNENTCNKDTIKKDNTKKSTTYEDNTKKGTTKNDDSEESKADTMKKNVSNKYTTHENAIKENTTKNDNSKDAFIKEVTTKEDTIVYYRAKTVTTKNDTIKKDTTKKSSTYESTIKKDTTKNDNSKVSIMKKDNIKKDTTNKKVTFKDNDD